jgi:hypothetical protein
VAATDETMLLAEEERLGDDQELDDSEPVGADEDGRDEQ